MSCAPCHGPAAAQLLLREPCPPLAGNEHGEPRVPSGDGSAKGREGVEPVLEFACNPVHDVQAASFGCCSSNPTVQGEQGNLEPLLAACCLAEDGGVLRPQHGTELRRVAGAQPTCINVVRQDRVRRCPALRCGRRAGGMALWSPRSAAMPPRRVRKRRRFISERQGRCFLRLPGQPSVFSEALKAAKHVLVSLRERQRRRGKVLANGNSTTRGKSVGCDPTRSERVTHSSCSRFQSPGKQDHVRMCRHESLEELPGT